jgi:hypothetical protein
VSEEEVMEQDQGPEASPRGEGTEEAPPFAPDLDLIGYLERGAKPDPKAKFRLPDQDKGR